MNDPDFDPYLPPRAPIGFSKAENHETEGIDGNPWLTVWTRPRATIRGIVDSDPTHKVALLSIVMGTSTAMNNALQKNAGETLTLPMLIAAFLIAGIIAGFLWNYLTAALVLWTGNLLGGAASYTEARAAIAWGCVPHAVNVGLMTLMTIVFGRDLYLKEIPEDQPMMPLALVATGILQIILGVWALFLMIKCMAEVHRFSAWRSLGAFVLAILFMMIIVVVVVVGWMMLGGQFNPAN